MVTAVSLVELRSEVERRYARLGLPAWPNPHPDPDVSPAEEYSRVTDPERYGVVHARARVWTEVLGELPGVSVEAVVPERPRQAGSVERHTWIRSSRPGALPLVLLERDAPLTGRRGGVLPVVEISALHPDIVLEEMPDCGCDGCDDGSEPLLEMIDEAVGRVVEGPLVLMRHRDWSVEWSPDRAGAPGLPWARAKALWEMCERIAAGDDVRLPRGAEAYVAHSWLS